LPRLRLNLPRPGALTTVSDWSDFKQRLLSFCRNASQHELQVYVTPKTLYIAVNGETDLRGGIGGYHVLEDLKDMLPRIRDDEDRILAYLVIASLVTKSKFKSLCRLALELERRYGRGTG